MTRRVPGKVAEGQPAEREDPAPGKWGKSWGGWTHPGIVHKGMWGWRVRRLSNTKLPRASLPRNVVNSKVVQGGRRMKGAVGPALTSAPSLLDASHRPPCTSLANAGRSGSLLQTGLRSTDNGGKGLL